MQSAPVESSHGSINNRIDEVYLETIKHAAQLRDYLDLPRGRIEEKYRDFKNPFFQLFLLTHNIKEMRNCSEASEKVQAWVSKPIKTETAREGLELLIDYQRCLFDALIITRNEGR